MIRQILKQDIFFEMLIFADVFGTMLCISVFEINSLIFVILLHRWSNIFLKCHENQYFYKEYDICIEAGSDEFHINSK